MLLSCGCLSLLSDSAAAERQSCVSYVWTGLSTRSSDAMYPLSMFAAANGKPAAKLSKKERIRQAKAKKRRDREAGSDDEDLGLGAPLED